MSQFYSAGILNAIPDSVDNQYPIDEGSGTTLFDDVGSEDGTISGATWVSDSASVGGQHLSFDNTNDIVSFATSAWDYAASSSFSVTAHVNPDDTSDDKTIISKGSTNSSSNQGWHLKIDDTETLKYVHPAVAEVGSLSVPTSGFSFVAARYDAANGEVTLTVDDTDETLSISSMQDPTGEAAYFGQDNNEGRHYGGEVDEVTLGSGLYSDSDLTELENRR